MSSDEQRAIDIFKRLYIKDHEILVILNSPGAKLKPLRVRLRAEKMKYLDDEETAFIDRVTGKEGFSVGEWEKILTKVVSEASAEPVEGVENEEKNTAKDRSKTLSRGSTTAWRKQSARTASKASQGPIWERGKKVPVPKGKMRKMPGTHLTTKTNYTSVELATAFCPGIKVDDNEARLLFGDDFLQILKQYNDLKDQIFREGDLFTEMLNCGRDNTKDLMDKLNGRSDERRIFYLLNYLEFLLNCLRQLIITFKAGEEFDGMVKMIQDEFDVVLKYLEGTKLKSGSGTDKTGKETFEFYLKRNNNYAKLLGRLTSNFGELINSIQTREERGESGVGGSGGWVKVSDKKEEENPRGHDYSKISNSRGLAGKVQKGSKLKKQKNPSGHGKYRLEWLLKSFMNNTIKLWCEENHSKIIEYIRKLKRKNNSDLGVANKAALEFLTKLMILLLQDINRVSSERLVNNKLLLSLFARSSLCSLLVNPEVFTKRASNYKFAQDMFTKEKLQASHIERLGDQSNKLKEGISIFGTQPISKHLQKELIFSPLDYYIAIIESQAGEIVLGDKSAEPTFSAHLKEFKTFIDKKKSFCYGSSYTKMFSLKLDEDMGGVRGEFQFKPLWDIGKEEELTGGMDWLSGASTVGLSREGNLSIIKTGEQTSAGSVRMELIANILTRSLGYDSALLCLGLSDIGSIAYKAGTVEDWNNEKSKGRLQEQVDSIDVWQNIVGTKCKLIYLLLPPVPWQDPREVLNGLWANQVSAALDNSHTMADFLNKSEQIIDVCNKIANRTYYEEYLGMWQKKQQEGQFDLWCLKESGISELQTCRVYTLQNIHYDYNLLRNLYFTDGVVGKNNVEGKDAIEMELEQQYLYIKPEQIYTIRQLSLHKFDSSIQTKYWLLDAQAQIFKENLAKNQQTMEIFVGSYKEYTAKHIKEILDVDLNLIKKEEDSGTQRLVGDKLATVFQGFKPLTAKNAREAKGPFAARLQEIWAKVSTEGKARDNTFKFLEHVMINITRAVQNLPQQVDKAQKRLLNYERTAVVLLLDNLVGLSFFRMNNSIEQGRYAFLQEYFYASDAEGGFALPWTSPRITAAAGFYIGSRRFNAQFIFDYCIGEFLGPKTRDNDKLMACCGYQNGEFVRRYVALLPNDETGLRLGSTATSASTSSQIPVRLQRQGSQDTDVEDSERRKAAREVQELKRNKERTEEEQKRLEDLVKKYAERDAFVRDHQVATSPRSQDESEKEHGESKQERGGGKRTRKRRKSKKPRKTKSKRFRKKKHKTRKKRYKKKRRKTRR